MSRPQLMIVDAPSIGANVLLDLNSRDDYTDVGPQSEGFTLGDLEPVGEADSLEVEYAQTIAFVLSVRGGRAHTLAFLGKLQRLLLRDSGWLMFRLHENTDPEWFSLLRPNPKALDFSSVYNDRDQYDWTLPIELPIEPFGFGERITFPAVTVDNDPATGACSFVLPEIKGDAPADLRVEINPSGDLGMHGYRFMHSVHSAETAHLPTVWQVGTGDGFTAGVDTGAGTASAAYSGGSYRAVSMDDKTLQTRISGAGPTTLAPGRYKVLVMLGRAGTDTIYSTRFGQYVGFGYQYGKTVITERAASTAEHRAWIDLGEFDMPMFRPPKGENQGFTPTPDIAVQVGVVGGTSSEARIDAIMFKPVDLDDTIDTTTLYTHFSGFGIAAGDGRGIWDGYRKVFWGYNAVGGIQPSRYVPVGGWPKAIPGAENVLTILQQVDGPRPFYGDDSSDDITRTLSVTVSYQPRYPNLPDQ